MGRKRHRGCADPAARRPLGIRSLASLAAELPSQLAIAIEHVLPPAGDSLLLHIPAQLEVLGQAVAAADERMLKLTPRQRNGRSRSGDIDPLRPRQPPQQWRDLREPAPEQMTGRAVVDEAERHPALHNFDRKLLNKIARRRAFL